MRQKEERNTQDKFSRRLANATVVIAVFTLVSVGVGALTYTAIKGQLNVMQGQLNEMKAASEQNAKLIVANEKLANATENAGRAWIAVTKFSFANFKDAADPLKTNIFYQNVGREPARAVKSRRFSGYIRNTNLPYSKWNFLPTWNEDVFRPEKMCDGIESEKSTSVIYPSATFGFMIDVGKADKLADSEIPILFGEVSQRTSLHYVTGCFSYETFKQTKYSTFCGFLSPNDGDIATWAYSACPVGNDDY